MPALDQVDSTVKAAMGFAARLDRDRGACCSTPVIAISEKCYRSWLSHLRQGGGASSRLAVVISAALGWLAAPHRVKLQGAPLAAASGADRHVDTSRPADRTGPNPAPEPAAETGAGRQLEIALARTDRAIADQPKRDGPQGVPALPEDVFVGVQPANDQSCETTCMPRPRSRRSTPQRTLFGRTRRAGR